MEPVTTYEDVVRHTPTGGTEPTNVSVTINGERWTVPMDMNNVHWAEIKALLDDGTLTATDSS
jgi:hypothetical protein